MRRVAAIVLLLAVSCASSTSDEAQVAQTPTPTTTETPTPAPTATDVPEPTPPGTVLLRFAAIGDWGAGTDEQMGIARRMCSWRRDHAFNLVLTAGDNIYDTGDPSYFEERFFEPYDCLLSDGVRFRSVLGNHDIGTDDGRPELNEPAFGMKGRNYVVRKKGVRFVMWDSNRSDRDWLASHLTEQQGDEWTVVAFHHPVFSPGPHGNTLGYSPSLVRLFARKGVDLVLNGHDHLYALMEPKRRVRYVVTGGGGARLYGCDNPEVSDVCIARHHFLYIVARTTRLDVKAVPASGRPFHSFTTTGRR